MGMRRARRRGPIFVYMYVVGEGRAVWCVGGLGFEWMVVEIGD